MADVAEWEGSTPAIEALLKDEGVAEALQHIASAKGRLVLREEGLPDWWAAGNNRLFAEPGRELPRIFVQWPDQMPENAVIVLGGADMPAEIGIWGAFPVILLGYATRLPYSHILCGDRSTVVVGDLTSCTFGASIDSRNGGSLIVREEGLWGGHVRLNTDDMHAIRDVATGVRVNAFGGTVRIERHVWLAEQVFVLGGTHIGEHCVIGARSTVRGTLPAHSVCAGTPARVVRSDVTWSSEDLP